MNTRHAALAFVTSQPSRQNRPLGRPHYQGPGPEVPTRAQNVPAGLIPVFLSQCLHLSQRLTPASHTAGLSRPGQADRLQSWQAPY